MLSAMTADTTTPVGQEGTAASLRALRQEAGLTQRAVAIALGVTDRTYIRWEQGETRPEADNLVALLAFFRAALKRPTLEASDLLAPNAEPVVAPASGGAAA